MAPHSTSFLKILHSKRPIPSLFRLLRKALKHLKKMPNTWNPKESKSIGLRKTSGELCKSIQIKQVCALLKLDKYFGDS